MFSAQGPQRERLVQSLIFARPAAIGANDLLWNVRPRPTQDEWAALLAVRAAVQSKADESSQLMHAYRQQIELLAQNLAEIVALEAECAHLKDSLGITPYLQKVHPSSVAQSSGLRSWQQSQMEFAVSEAVASDATTPLTTLLVQNLPQRLTQDNLLKLWPPDGTYDFLHLPRSVKQRRNSSYVFVNFRSPEAAESFRREWHEQSLQYQSRSKRISISFASLQGFEANVLRSKQSDEFVTGGKYLPALFDSVGRRLEFREVLNVVTASPGDS